MHRHPDPGPVAPFTPAPIIGIGCGIEDPNHRTRRAYADAVIRAGGIPVLLPPPAAPMPEIVRAHAKLCSGFVLTGGADPRTEAFGVPTHPAAKPEHPARQAYDEALLRELCDHHPNKPVLGVCLGMQMMALCAGGVLDQHLPDTTPTHPDHIDDHAHPIQPAGADSPIPDGEVTSWHRQAVKDPGSMRIVALAHDGVIEAIDDPGRAFYLGVQWHPERSGSGALGDGLFQRLIAAACGLPNPARS